MLRFPIARPGYPYLAAAFVVTILLWWWGNILFYPSFFAFLFIGWFFRDPPRQIPNGKDYVLAPADGRVIRVEEVWEPDYIGGEAIKVSIFLSLFNVHVNRSPCEGLVTFCRHIPGVFLPAYKDEAPSRNERNMIGLETACGKMLLVQIAGLVARRIVCWVDPGDHVNPGVRIGMIKFGSCTELYLPAGAQIMVKEGDKVRGGETVLGKYDGECEKTGS